MPVEKSDLLTSGPLHASNAGYLGGSGSGNDLPLADLQQGFSKLPDPDTPPAFYPQNADDGENYVGDPFNPGHGFLTRPEGWER